MGLGFSCELIFKRDTINWKTWRDLREVFAESAPRLPETGLARIRLHSFNSVELRRKFLCPVSKTFFFLITPVMM